MNTPPLCPGESWGWLFYYCLQGSCMAPALALAWLENHKVQGRASVSIDLMGEPRLTPGMGEVGPGRALMQNSTGEGCHEGGAPGRRGVGGV